MFLKRSPCVNEQTFGIRFGLFWVLVCSLSHSPFLSIYLEGEELRFEREGPVQGTVLIKILSDAGYEPSSDLDTESLVDRVNQHRKDTSAAEKARRSAKAIFAVRSWIVAIVISYVDLAGDVLVGSTLVQSDTSQRAGYITLGLTGFSQIAQATISMAMGQGPAAAFAALVGAKPLLGTLSCKGRKF